MTIESTTPSTRSFMKKAVAAGVIGLTALGATAIVPNIANAQNLDAATTEERAELTDEERAEHRAERQAAHQERRAEKIAKLAEVLGIADTDLAAALESGSTLAEIAEANGVSLDELVTAIVDSRAEHIQEHVDAGDITSDQAAERLATLEERVTERVTSEPGEHRDGEARDGSRRGRGHGHGRGGFGHAGTEAPDA